MLKKNLFIVCLLALVLPLQAQKVKIDKEYIFADKKEKLVYDAAYKKMLPTDTYTYRWMQAPLSGNVSSILPLGKDYGKLVKASEGPDYTFELYASQAYEPKIDYIKVTALFPRLQNTNYIARITYASNFSVKILNKQKEVVKTILISNEKNPYVYYYALYSKNSPSSATPQVIAADDMRDTYTVGWLTPELLAMRMKEDRTNVMSSVLNSTMSALLVKARQEIYFMMCDTRSSIFHMCLIKEKQQQEYPELTAQLADLRTCFVQWAQHKDDNDNLQKLAAFATDLEAKGNTAEDKNLRLLYKMNAALAYIVCQNYDKGISIVHEAGQDERGFNQMASITAEHVYSAWKKYNVAQQSGDTFDATQSFDLEKDYKNLSQR